jgi:hypothetical protein
MFPGGSFASREEFYIKGRIPGGVLHQGKSFALREENLG